MITGQARVGRFDVNTKLAARITGLARPPTTGPCWYEPLADVLVFARPVT